MEYFFQLIYFLIINSFYKIFFVLSIYTSVLCIFFENFQRLLYLNTPPLLAFSSYIYSFLAGFSILGEPNLNSVGPRSLFLLAWRPRRLGCLYISRSSTWWAYLPPLGASRVLLPPAGPAQPPGYITINIHCVILSVFNSLMHFIFFLPLSPIYFFSLHYLISFTLYKSN